MEASVTKNFDLMNGIRITVMVLILFVVYKLLRKFNLLGENQETKDIKELAESPALGDSFNNSVIDPEKPFISAIKKKFGKKPTPQQLETLLPHKAQMPKMITTIRFDVHKTFSKNQVTKIFNVIKTLKSQYEINFFATMYGIVTHDDFFSELDKLMPDEKLAQLNDIIKAKPII